MTTAKTQLPICTWNGVSGTGYKFSIFAIPTSLNAGQDGNYIYAGRNAEGQWIPIYIGEGDLAERSGSGHHKADCIRQKGATHFHCHLNGDQHARRQEEADLLGYYTNAFVPHGCNEQATG